MFVFFVPTRYMFFFFFVVPFFFAEKTITTTRNYGCYASGLFGLLDVGEVAM